MPDRTAEKIAALQTLDTSELRARWKHAFKHPAPKRASRDLLLRALVYRAQEQVEGGLRKAARKRLARPSDPNDNGDHLPKPRASRLKPGTRLVREWRGDVHQVTVTADGFEYRGDQYKSLSQIARTITGTRWSGPLFFGLRKAETHADATQDVC